jgi:hypothetical protein
MAEYKDREHFIPLRRSELVDLLGADKGLGGPDRDLFRQFCRLVTATFHFEYNQRLEELKDSYAPFDPDSDTRALAKLGGEERQHRLNTLFSDFAWLMERANFKHLSQEDLEPALHQTSAWGIPMEVDFSAFERFAVFARGDARQRRTRRRLSNFYRLEETQVEVYQRLVLILKMRQHQRLPENVDTNSVYLKVFKNIPKQDIKMLLPAARVHVSRFDKGKIGVPLAGGLGWMAWKLLGTLGATLYTLGDDLARILLSTPADPTLLWGAALGVAGYGYRGYYGLQQTKQRYHHSLTQSLYYQNLDSNAGVLTRLLDEAEEQEGREAILAYFFLWRYAGSQGWTKESLDDYIEMFLEGSAGLKVDFEIGDAIAKIERMRLVQKDGQRYRAVPIDKALEMLDWTWDNYFKYANPEPENPPIP